MNALMPRPRGMCDKASAQGSMKMIAIINDGAVIKKILDHTSAPSVQAWGCGKALWDIEEKYMNLREILDRGRWILYSSK